MSLSLLQYGNRLGLVPFTRCVEQSVLCATGLPGWVEVTAFTLEAQDGSFWDFEIRCATGTEIFRQNLYDHGWAERTLLHGWEKSDPLRHKTILYFCAPGLPPLLSGWHQVPDCFVLGSHWATIRHCYCRLPDDPPFDVSAVGQWPPDSGAAVQGFATTRRLMPMSPGLRLEAAAPTAAVPPAPRPPEGGLRTQGRLKLSTPAHPVISVVTVVFNGEPLLEQTIQSVINQTYDNIEYIVIDGGSRDGTLGLIQKYAEQIDYWVSEPDSGIYDAMNKGMTLASGEWIHFLNAGDYFVGATVVERLMAQVSPTCDGLYGDSLIYYRHLETKFIRKQPARLVNELWKGMICSHQSLVLRREQAARYPFELRHRMGADFAVLFHLYRAGGVFRHTPMSVSISTAKGAADRERLTTLLDWWRTARSFQNELRVHAHYLLLIGDAVCRLAAKRLLPTALREMSVRLKYRGFGRGEPH